MLEGSSVVARFIGLYREKECEMIVRIPLVDLKAQYEIIKDEINEAIREVLRASGLS